MLFATSSIPIIKGTDRGSTRLARGACPAGCWIERGACYCPDLSARMSTSPTYLGLAPNPANAKMFAIGGAVVGGLVGGFVGKKVGWVAGAVGGALGLGFLAWYYFSGRLMPTVDTSSLPMVH